MSDQVTISISRNFQLCSISQKNHAVNDILCFQLYTESTTWNLRQIRLLTLSLMLFSHDSTACIVYLNQLNNFLRKAGNKKISGEKIRCCKIVLLPEEDCTTHSSAEATLSCLILGHDFNYQQQCHQQRDHTSQVDQISSRKILIAWFPTLKVPGLNEELYVYLCI